MKIAVINSGNHGSIGGIIQGISVCATEKGHKINLYCPPGKMQKKNLNGNAFIGSIIERRLSDIINTFTGRQGALNIFGTSKLLKQLDAFKPDIIHIHNLHSNYVNIRKLFIYIKHKNIKVVWTLHDCWAFTGHCPHFETLACDKWKEQCYDCPAFMEYPKTFIDKSKQQYAKKKDLFCGVKNLIIVVPSQWLYDQVKHSFLMHYPCTIINNGINLEIFKPRKSMFRKNHNLETKYIILAVAFSWGFKKGQDRVERLAEALDDRFVVVMVGINASEVNSNKIICVPRTSDQEQLAEIYSAADILLNPTREDTFPTVNIEALACGTPVLSYGAGGSLEAFNDLSGRVVNDENVIGILNELINDKYYFYKDCINRSKKFDASLKYIEYINLYENLINNKTMKQ